MKPLNIYLQAWKTTVQQGRLWILLYGFNVLFALLVVLPLRSYFKDSIGNSLATDALLQNFDWDIISDFLNNYGGGLSMWQHHVLLLLFTYLLFSAFTMGGIVNSLANRAFHRSEFWAACSRFFWRMLRLGIFFLILQGILLGLVVMLISFFAKGFSTEVLQTEVTIINAFFGVGIPYLLIALVLAMLHNYAKVRVVHQSDIWLTRPTLQGIGFALRHFLQSYPLYILNCLFALLFFGVYKFVEMKCAATSNAMIWSLFLWGQLFVALRIGMKIVNLASVQLLYESKR